MLEQSDEIFLTSAFHFKCLNFFYYGREYVKTVINKSTQQRNCLLPVAVLFAPKGSSLSASFLSSSILLPTEISASQREFLQS